MHRDVEAVHSFDAELQCFTQNARIPSLIVTRRVQILQHDQHLVSLGTSRQADGGPTAPIGGVVLVPVRLHLVGPHFTGVGAVRVPATGALGLRRELDVLDDHGRPVAALQVQPDDLPVAAPQRLDLRADAQGRRAARPQDEILVLRVHFQSELHGEEEEEEEEEECVLSASSTN